MIYGLFKIASKTQEGAKSPFSTLKLTAHKKNCCFAEANKVL